MQGYNKYNLLKAYCHYPLDMALDEHNYSQKDIYRITTINWTLVTNLENTETGYSYVLKNIYEMSLEEFMYWAVRLKNEKVINVEKISEQ